MENDSGEEQIAMQNRIVRSNAICKREQANDVLQ